MSFDPIAEGHKTAQENAKLDQEATHGDNTPEVEATAVADAQKLAKKNAKVDKANTNEAKMVAQDVGTAERDIPEGAPVTDTPEESKTDESKASSKDADVKKAMPDNQKRQDTDKDSATPSPEGDNSPKETPADKSNTTKKAGKKQFLLNQIHKYLLEKPAR